MIGFIRSTGLQWISNRGASDPTVSPQNKLTALDNALTSAGQRPTQPPTRQRVAVGDEWLSAAEHARPREHGPRRASPTAPTRPRRTAGSTSRSSLLPARTPTSATTVDALVALLHVQPTAAEIASYVDYLDHSYLNGVTTASPFDAEQRDPRERAGPRPPLHPRPAPDVRDALTRARSHPMEPPDDPHDPPVPPPAPPAPRARASPAATSCATPLGCRGHRRRSARGSAGASRSRPARPLGNKMLVIIDLDGGCDTLNAVIPSNALELLLAAPEHRHPGQPVARADRRARQLELPRSTRRFDTYRDLWNAGDVALVNRVGYPSENQSHFESQDIYSFGVRGSFAPLGVSQSGWIARYAEHYAADADGRGVDRDGPSPRLRRRVVEPAPGRQPVVLQVHRPTTRSRRTTRTGRR